MMMVIYDNEALRSAQFDIAWLVYVCVWFHSFFCYSFRNASVLLSTFLPSDYDPSHSHWTKCFYCFRCMFMYRILYCIHSVSSHTYIWSFVEYEITVTSNENHSHIVVAIRIQIYTLMTGSKKETWDAFTLDTYFQRKMETHNNRYITLSRRQSFEELIYSHKPHISSVIFSTCLVAMEINSSSKCHIVLPEHKKKTFESNVLLVWTTQINRTHVTCLMLENSSFL